MTGSDLSKPLILVVEDEAALIALLKYNLENEGYRVVAALDGEEGFLRLKEQKPDLAILDWMMPGVSGVELCRRIRRDGDLKDMPVIMLTARAEETDKVRGFDVGADDYLTKPFSLPELMARIRAHLRRLAPARTAEALEYADLAMDLATHRVSRNGRFLHLGPTEFRLLRFMMQNPERVFSRESLLDSVWGRDIYVEPRTVDVHIRRLRKVLNEKGESDIIRTVRAAGYSLDKDGAQEGE